MKVKFLLIILFVIPTFIYGNDSEPQKNLPGITEHHGKLYINSPPGQVLKLKADDLPLWARTKLVTVGALAICAGPPDTIVTGAQNVTFRGLPVARLGDTTVHGGVITEGSKTIYINGVPAAFVGGMHHCPALTGPVIHIGGPIATNGPQETDIGSIASEQLAVPSILNSTQFQAQGILSEMGLVLNLKWEKQATERTQVGKIYQQLPSKGQAIKPGGKVDAWAYYTEVPAVVETPVDQAMSAITAAWLKPHKGKENEVQNETKWNKVAAQSLEAGKKVFQADLPVTLDVYIKPKKKKSNSHPLVGQWEGTVKQATLPKRSVLWNIASVSPSGKFTVIFSNEGKKETLQGILKGSQMNITSPTIHINGDVHKQVVNAIWDKNTMTIKGTVVPYMNNKNMIAGKGFSIILSLAKKQ